MDFVLDNKITVDSLLTVILAIVFIIQTIYLARQTNVGVRLNQANLREVWEKKFENVNIDLLIKKDENTIPDETEFKKLVSCFDRMRPFFRAKLLKPSDFAHTFMVLDGATNSERLRKTKTYKEEYLTLQHVYKHFNKDYDMIDYGFELPNTSWYDSIFQRFIVLREHPNLRKGILDNWPFYQKAMKFRVIFDAKVRRHPIYLLKPPVEES